MNSTSNNDQSKMIHHVRYRWLLGSYESSEIGVSMVYVS